MMTCAAVALTLAGGSVLGGSRAAYAADAPAFGSVDLQKIQAGYTKRADLERSIQDINVRLSNQLKTQSGSDMLNLQQQQELQALLSKTAPTDADKARITALQEQSNKDAAELTALQQKANATADEKARMSALTNQRKAGQQILQQVSESYSEQFKTEADKINGQFTDSVKQAIAAVAKDKNLSVVFDSAVAVYTANDISDEVLKRLNK
ncbi:MAG: hypothetical protein JWQ02_406 [Capsulimonas sp.]|jgi:Skp family chaperone for outer membrane proteins|nr:hypothetical protein [Capsulimonas sp.]